MKSKYSLFLLLITAVCFVTSALEVNTEHVKNTFGDQYDSYFLPDNTSTHNDVTAIDRNFLPEFPTFFGSFVIPASRSVELFGAGFYKSPYPKLSSRKFIVNLSLLI